jgi:pimeloyl-ACP methyl ester carboxylesterase
VVLAHGAWADGSSWSKVIVGLNAKGVKAWAVPLPLTSFADDVAALDRTLDRVDGPVIVGGHAYAGAVIAGTRSEKVKGLVYVTALAPDEGETVADVFYHASRIPRRRNSRQIATDLSGFRRTLSLRPSPRTRPPKNVSCWRQCSDRSLPAASV